MSCVLQYVAEPFLSGLREDEFPATHYLHLLEVPHNCFVDRINEVIDADLLGDPPIERIPAARSACC